LQHRTSHQTLGRHQDSSVFPLSTLCHARFVLGSRSTALLSKNPHDIHMIPGVRLSPEARRALKQRPESRLVSPVDSASNMPTRLRMHVACLGSKGQISADTDGLVSTETCPHCRDSEDHHQGYSGPLFLQVTRVQ
jgi:hypothetical protein